MVGQKRLIDDLKQRNIREKYKVLIGGAPVSRKWVEEIGADGSAENAVSAVKRAERVASLILFFFHPLCSSSLRLL
ncbi:unnamed protein product [marine sediment metagenome]|uniref:B12-binding domain-containing protein n=1 Tax=marine sediment metagenome TaxID=412755 RepID=X1EGD2_9ZZZZ